MVIVLKAELVEQTSVKFTFARPLCQAQVRVSFLIFALIVIPSVQTSSLLNTKLLVFRSSFKLLSKMSELLFSIM